MLESKAVIVIGTSMTFSSTLSAVTMTVSWYAGRISKETVAPPSVTCTDWLEDWKPSRLAVTVWLPAATPEIEKAPSAPVIASPPPSTLTRTPGSGSPSASETVPETAPSCASAGQGGKPRRRKLPRRRS